jgi:enamine deaminase RidA (YjgF/YER057c/UK114 family)
MKTQPRLLALAICISVQAAMAQEISSLYLEPRAGSARAVTVKDVPLVHTAQILPLDADGRVASPNDVRRQVDRLFDLLKRVLESSGGDLGRLVRVNVYATDRDHFAVVREVLSRTLAGMRTLPAATWSVTPLPKVGAAIALDGVAVSGRATGDTVSRKRVDGVPEMCGPTHVAVLPAGSSVYISGMAGKGNMTTATRSTMEQLAGTMKGLGLSRDDVVHVRTFLQPMSDVDAATKEIVVFFGERAPPPITHFAWNLGDPIEIELIAAGNGLTISAENTERVQYYTPPGIAASPYYARVAIVRGGPRIFTGSVVSDRSDDAEADVRGMFRGLEALLRETGSDMKHMVKATYFVRNDAASKALTKVRGELYDPRRPPSASKAGVDDTGFEGRASAVDMIAVPTTR